MITNPTFLDEYLDESLRFRHRWKLFNKEEENIKLNISILVRNKGKSNVPREKLDFLSVFQNSLLTESS